MYTQINYTVHITILEFEIVNEIIEEIAMKYIQFTIMHYF